MRGGVRSVRLDQRVDGVFQHDRPTGEVDVQGHIAPEALADRLGGCGHMRQHRRLRV